MRASVQAARCMRDDERESFETQNAPRDAIKLQTTLVRERARQPRFKKHTVDGCHFRFSSFIAPNNSQLIRLCIKKQTSSAPTQLLYGLKMLTALKQKRREKLIALHTRIIFSFLYMCDASVHFLPSRVGRI